MASTTSQTKASATRAVFNVVELREAIFAQLDLEQIHSARRVCRDWRDCIDNSIKLKRCMFKLPIAHKPDPVRFNDDSIGTVTTVPFVLNPIFKRIIYAPTSAFRYGLIENDAYVQPRNLLQRIENAQPLYENMLDIQTQKRCNWSICGCNNIDMGGRRFKAIGQPEPFQHDFELAAGWQKEEKQSSWKDMYISQPPVKEIVVANPYNRDKMSDRIEDGFTVGDLLGLIEGLFLLASEDGLTALPTGRLDIEMLVPLGNADGTGPAKVRDGSATWWRALKTRLKLEVVQDLSLHGPYMQPFHFPFMPDSNGEMISLIT